MSQFRSVPATNLSVKKAFFSFSTVKSLLISSCLALTLAACGGGGSSASGNFDGTGGPPPGSGPGPVPSTPTPALYKIGTGSGSTFQDGVISASDTDLDAGEAITLRVNVVTETNEVPTAPFTVTFTSPCVATGLAILGTQSIVTTGLFSVPYTNNGCSGEDIVTARIVENGDTAAVKLTVRAAQVLSVSFVRTDFDQLSLAGIGGNETAQLTFKVSGAQGSPVVGKQVNFSINTQAGGASILAGNETGVTDQAGEVRTILKSGTIAGPVNVKAVHVETGRQGLSPDIIISTGVAEASRFSLSYQPFNPAKAFNTDGITVSISIIASDTFGNNPPDGTRVSFVAPESGNIVNFCLLENGGCTVNWRSTSPRPDDMRLEIIAFTDGAEDFVDRNGNSVYDINDGAITDLGEPFADENENDKYDVDEYFFDTNHNGVRDPGNGRWDGPCLSKVDPTAICTGNDTVTIYSTATIVMPTNTGDIIELGNFPPVGETITLSQGSSISLGGIILADSNIFADEVGSNPLPFGAVISFLAQGSGISLQNAGSDTVPNAIYPTGPYGTVLVAEPVTGTAPLPTGTRLVLNIQIPGVNAQQFTWPVQVTP